MPSFLTHSFRVGVAAGLVLLVSGCAGRTRLPSLGVGDPRAERNDYLYHDPMPEGDIGPLTSGRPRGFEVQRSEPRRAIEKSMPAEQLSAPGGTAAKPRYPATVRP